VTVLEAGGATPGSTVRTRNVFIVLNNAEEVGGVQRVAHQLAQRFSEAGHSVHLIGISHHSEPVRYIEQPLYRTTVLYDDDEGPGKAWKPKSLRDQVDVKARLAEAQRIKRREAAVAKLDRIFASVPDGIVIVMQVFAMEWIAHTNTKHLRIIGQSHESYEASRGLTAATVGSTRYNRMKRLFADIDLFQLLTQADADKFERDGMCNVSVMHNALTFYPDQVSDLTAKTVISIGRYHPQKNYPALLDAWVHVARQHPDWQLKIFGHGPDEEMLKDYARRRGVDGSAHFMGPTSEVEKELLASSIFALSSDFEGLPLVLGEAMACGVPCVSVDCAPGIREIIADGEDGLVVPLRNPKALAEALCRLIEDEPLRRSMGAAARTNITRFSTEAIMRRWHEVFDMVER
jgi:glycosyltransferase involved in cell wall biosynthesis